MSQIRILAIGDVVQESGTNFVRRRLWDFRREKKIDFVIINGENSGARSHIDKDSAETLLDGGADVITTGNHVWNNRDFHSYLDNSENVLRPANYPDVCAGKGYTILNVDGYRYLVMCLQGTVFMDSLDSPFHKAEHILEREKGNFDFALCDFHAEATSEKTAFAMFFDGKINVVFGTHTHIQTNDARVLKNGTGYVTDLGMTGVFDSVLGLDADTMIKKFYTKMPVFHKVAEGDIVMSGAIFTLDTDTKKCLSVELVNLK
ncbi:MAG: TIGR00282 family metallophosphoesterase [Ruminococcaceae bacterium]|nr:TIGR00282 family metallophosphoesterase [Oscillospiraceae bacterium]